jgi:hypothetical protein
MAWSKLVPVDQGGVATQPAEQVLWREKTRQTDICAEGFGMSRIVWADCFGAGRERARARLRKEYAVTEARFGGELPAEMRQFASDHPRERRPRLWKPDLGQAA